MGYKLNNESSMSYEDVKIIEELIERKIILTERLIRKIGISKESLLYRIQKINSSLLHNEDDKIEIYDDKFLYLRIEETSKLTQETQKIKRTSKELRKETILIQLLFTDEILNLNELTSFFSVVRNTVKSDVDEVFADNNINKFDYEQSNSKIQYINKKIPDHKKIKEKLVEKYIFSYINGTEDMYIRRIVNLLNEELKIFHKSYLNMAIRHTLEETYNELSYYDYNKLMTKIVLMISSKKGKEKRRGLEIRESHLMDEINVAHQLKKIEKKEEVFFTSKEKNEIMRFISKANIGLVDSGSAEYQVSDDLIDYNTRKDTLNNVLFIKDVGDKDFENILLRIMQKYNIKNFNVMSFLEYFNSKIFGNIDCIIFITENDDFNDIGKNSAVKILINLKNYENDIQALEVIKKIKG